MAHTTVEHTDAEHDHPDDSVYIKIALLLGAITAGEVALFYVNVGKAMVPLLILMMIAKFSIVGAYFMHLKFDSNLFTRVFVSGIILAIGVYIAFLSSLHIWNRV